MPYLIDGHNVIAQMTSISLNDPEDEAKLVLKLRSYSAHLDKKMQVVFDGGIPGGASRLSTSRVEVYFASADSSADNVLRMLIRNLKSPESWIIVSSDQAIVSVAQRRGMKLMRAERFAQRLEEFEASTQQAAAQVEDETTLPKVKAEPRLSKSEVEEWLDIFSRKDKKKKK